MLLTATPAGIEKFLKKRSIRLRSSVPMPLNEAFVGRLMAAAARYGLQLLPPACKPFDGHQRSVSFYSPPVDSLVVARLCTPSKPSPWPWPASRGCRMSMCSSRSTPISAAPLTMSSRFTLPRECLILHFLAYALQFHFVNAAPRFHIGAGGQKSGQLIAGEQRFSSGDTRGTPL